MKDLQKTVVAAMCLMLLMLCCSQSVSARSHLFRNLSHADGMQDLLVNAILRDSMQMTWFGTATTLECFDGVHLRHYPLPGPDNPRKRITALAHSTEHTLWVGNGNGLYKMSLINGTLEPQYETELTNGVTALLYLPGEGLYIGTSQGIYIREQRSPRLRHILMQPNQMGPANEVNGLLLGHDGLVWIATNNGLHAITTGPDHILSHYYFNEKETGLSPAINCLASVGDSIFLGTHTGELFAFSPATGGSRLVSREEGIPIMAMQGVGRDSLFVATDGDGVRIRSISKNSWVKSFVHDGTATGLTSNSVYSLLVDPDGLLWAGSYQQGLDYMLQQHDLVGVHSTSLFDTEGLAVRALAIHDEQRLFAIPGGLQFVDKERHLTRHFGYQDLHAQMIFSLLYHNGLYYVGTFGGGLYSLDPERLTLRPISLQTERHERASQVFVITSADDGTLWIGSDVGVFHMGKDGRQESFTHYNSQLPRGNVYEIFFDSTGRGWFCTETGMVTFDPDSHAIRADAFPSGFNYHDKIRIVFETSKHELYFFPDKGSLFITDLALHPITMSEPLFNYIGSEGQCIIEDHSNRLWIGGNNGLCYINRDSTVCRVDFADGLPSPTFNLGKPQLDEKGIVWLCNSQGLLYILPDSVDLQPRPKESVHVTDVLVNNQSDVVTFRSVWHDQHINVETAHPTMTFRFSDFCYTLPSCLEYECRLDGVDEDWHTLLGKAEMTYYNLAWGNYRLHVRRPDDPASETTVSIHVPISNMMLALIAGCILGLLAMAALVVMMVYRRRKAENQLITLTQSQDGDGSDDKYRAITVSERELKKLSRQLDRLMQEKKVYLNPDLRTGDLAEMLGTTQYVLSYLLNQHLKIGYYDYVNNYRIEEFKNCVKHEEVDRYTLDALALKCGFSSRTSFFRYFKKVSGKTPSEYIREQRGVGR